jgi:hypothetical protein
MVRQKKRPRKNDTDMMDGPSTSRAAAATSATGSRTPALAAPTMDGPSTSRAAASTSAMGSRTPALAAPTAGTATPSHALSLEVLRLAQENKERCAKLGVQHMLNEDVNDYLVDKEQELLTRRATLNKRKARLAARLAARVRVTKASLPPPLVLPNLDVEKDRLLRAKAEMNQIQRRIADRRRRLNVKRKTIQEMEWSVHMEEALHAVEERAEADLALADGAVYPPVITLDGDEEDVVDVDALPSDPESPPCSPCTPRTPDTVLLSEAASQEESLHAESDDEDEDEDDTSFFDSAAESPEPSSAPETIPGEESESDESSSADSSSLLLALGVKRKRVPSSCTDSATDSDSDMDGNNKKKKKFKGKALAPKQPNGVDVHAKKRKRLTAPSSDTTEDSELGEIVDFKLGKYEKDLDWERQSQDITSDSDEEL